MKKLRIHNSCSKKKKELGFLFVLVVILHDNVSTGPKFGAKNYLIFKLF